jgi:hypothetical protein
MEDRAWWSARSVAWAALTLSTMAALTAASYAVHTSITTAVALYGSYWRRRHPGVMQRRELGRGTYYVN